MSCFRHLIIKIIFNSSINYGIRASWSRYVIYSSLYGPSRSFLGFSNGIFWMPKSRKLVSQLTLGSTARSLFIQVTVSIASLATSPGCVPILCAFFVSITVSKVTSGFIDILPPSRNSVLGAATGNLVLGAATGIVYVETIEIFADTDKE